jgi:hypothetical protein
MLADRKSTRRSAAACPPADSRSRSTAETPAQVPNRSTSRRIGIGWLPVAVHYIPRIRSLGFVFSGGICHIQGDGSQVTLRPGDVLVQNGAVHAWQNRADQPCMVCFVVIGAPRR